MKKQWFFINESAADMPEMSIIGRIGPYDEVDYASFKNAFDNTIKPKGKGLIIINSVGGDMIEGFGIYDHIMESKCAVDVKIIGMAASMSSVIAMVGKKITMAKNSLLMIHRPQSSIKGESDALRSMADLADKLEEKAIAIYKQRSGKSDEVVREWMKPGMMKWFTAQEAMKAGLADDMVTDDRVKIAAAVDVSSEEAAWNVYSIIDEKFLFKPNTAMNKEQMMALALEMGLPTSASVDEILAEAKARKGNSATVTELTNQLTEKETEITNLKKDARKKEIEVMVDGAIREGRFPAGQKSHFTSLAEKDFDGVKALIEAMPKNKSVEGQLGDGAADTEVVAMMKMSWDELDKASKLPVLKQKNFDGFKAKYKEKFNKEYAGA